MVVFAFVVLVAQIAVAGPGSSGDPQATERASVKKQLKALKKQVKTLQKEVDELSRDPGPQGPEGPQGPAGSAPACRGNDAGDIMVAAGSVCIDRYEASVWSSPTGGTQYGVSGDDYPCNDSGQNCTGANAIYARSVAGVAPSRRITYFQAQQALANVGKRLPSNAEWQQAAAGTPDPGTDNGTSDCNVTTANVVTPTGSRSSCVSNFGANDMVGNVVEWVGDWVPASTATPGWASVGTFSSDDTMQLAGASTTGGPGALVRGGNYQDATNAGPFFVRGGLSPQSAFFDSGFRGAR